jgi:hypothetical protein
MFSTGGNISTISKSSSDFYGSANIIDAATLLEMFPKKKGRRPNYLKELIE